VVVNSLKFRQLTIYIRKLKEICQRREKYRWTVWFFFPNFNLCSFLQLLKKQTWTTKWVFFKCLPWTKKEEDIYLRLIKTENHYMCISSVNAELDFSSWDWILLILPKCVFNKTCLFLLYRLNQLRRYQSMWLNWEGLERVTVCFASMISHIDWQNLPLMYKIPMASTYIYVLWLAGVWHFDQSLLHAWTWIVFISLCLHLLFHYIPGCFLI